METIYTPDFTAIKEALTQTWTLGTEWLIPLVIAILVMAVLTRDTDKWKILALPIFVLERIIGIPVHFVLMSVAGIIFVIEALSTQVVGNLLGTAKKWTQGEDIIARSRMEREYRKANSLLAEAKRREAMNLKIGQAKEQGLIPTGITKLLEKSRKKRKW